MSDITDHTDITDQSSDITNQYWHNQSNSDITDHYNNNNNNHNNNDDNNDDDNNKNNNSHNNNISIIYSLNSDKNILHLMP